MHGESDAEVVRPPAHEPSGLQPFQVVAADVAPGAGPVGALVPFHQLAGDDQVLGAEQRTVVRWDHPRAGQRRELTEEGAQDPLPPPDEDSLQLLVDERVLNLRLVDDGAHPIHADAGDDAGHPGLVVLLGREEGGVRIAGSVDRRIETLDAEVAQHLTARSLLGVAPGALDQAEGHEVLEQVLEIEVARVAQPSADPIPAPLAPEAVAPVDVVVAHVPGRPLLVALADPHRQRVLLAGVEVVDPCGEHVRAPKLPPVLVRDHVVRIVVPGPLVAPGAERDPRQELTRSGSIAPVR